MEIDLQRRRKTRKLASPVRSDRHRRNDERGTPRPAVQDKRDRLRSLAKAHVVRKARPESPLREKCKPAHPTQLVVAQDALESGWRFKHAEAVLAAQLVDEAAQPTVSAHALDAQSAGAAQSEGERHRVARRSLAPLHVAQCAECLAEDGPVHFDPAVAEENERRVLVKQELYFLFGHHLAVHADRELGLHGRARFV